MSLRVRQIRFYQCWMRTRFPFRFGIASMSRVVHLFVRADVEIDGNLCTGISAEGLPPKWFTKNASTQYEEDDLPAMLRVIEHAAKLAVELGPQRNPFDWWWELQLAQSAWAKENDLPPLLAGLGTSLMERAVIDAYCRHHRTTFFQALQCDALQMDLPRMHGELESARVAEFLPKHARRSVHLRHTVGLGDPLTENEISAELRVDDGLPQSLESSIRHHGLRFFKVKLSGNREFDRDRLSRLAPILENEVGAAARFTLDGNEQFDNIDLFRSCWETFRGDPVIRAMIDQSLLFVEQPLHRDRALHSDVGREFASWPDAPPTIIDESDAQLGSLDRALSLGYRGTSHKNCKGVFKSLAAAAVLARRSTPQDPLILSGEDLGNIGPVALLQDLAVVAALGLQHVERNGHHYFAGLSMFARPIQDQVTEHHADLYRWHPNGFAALAPDRGRLHLNSVNLAPFGVMQLPDLESMESCDRA